MAIAAAIIGAAVAENGPAQWRTSFIPSIPLEATASFARSKMRACRPRLAASKPSWPKPVSLWLDRWEAEREPQDQQTGTAPRDGPRIGATLRQTTPRRTPMNFAGKAAVITGAGNGIGRQTALAFAAAGASVLAVDRDAAAVEATAAAIRQQGGVARIETADVT